jgi:hypothetical protein
MAFSSSWKWGSLCGVAPLVTTLSRKSDVVVSAAGRLRMGCLLMGAWLGLNSVACSGSDVTRLDGDVEAEAADADAAETSRTLAVLAQPEALDTLCQLIGVSGLSGAPGDAASCAQAVERCQSGVGSFVAATQGEVPAPQADLEQLLGCPLKLSDLDACTAQVLERSRDTYSGTLSCDAAPPRQIDPAFLFAVPSCLGVVLRCPQLLTLTGLL